MNIMMLLLLFLFSPQCVLSLNTPSSGLVSGVYLRRQRKWSRVSVCLSDTGLKMERIYMQSDEHFQVFTTVLTPQGE